jgi:hypothetical protein
MNSSPRFDGSPWPHAINDVLVHAFVDPEHGAFIHGSAMEALTFLPLPNAPSGLGRLYLTDDGGSTWHPDRVPA